MQVSELIRKKRDGSVLTRDELQHLISGYVAGKVPDYQMSAFLMACYFNGMSAEEALAFTELMLHSGQVIDLSDVSGVKVDKHSTGGVGDKVSLLLAPIVASCGVPVPMISGRGLGHTGGTLDKLESIPGFRTDLSIAEYKKVIQQIGVVMIGQTADIAPADKKMYALRDVTATIECIPLIAGSIMSKKLAEGIDALVLDIKTGPGAFMKDHDQAVDLAKTLVGIGTRFGKATMGFVTDMSQPLGIAIGNWLEVVESVECLKGTRGVNDGSADLVELTHVLAGAMLMLGKKAHDMNEGRTLSREAVSSGRAYEKFLELVKAQKGDPDAIEQLNTYPVAQHMLEAKAKEEGFVHDIDVRELGLVSVMLGAGRMKMDDAIDPKAGILLEKKIGDPVKIGETLAKIHTDREPMLEEARSRVVAAFRIRPVKAPPPPLIYDVVDSSGVHPWR